MNSGAVSRTSRSEEQSELHSRASLWLAEHGMAEAAALHALASGASERAYELAERSLYEALIHRGRQGAVENLLARIKTRSSTSGQNCC